LPSTPLLGIGDEKREVKRFSNGCFQVFSVVSSSSFGDRETEWEVLGGRAPGCIQNGGQDPQKRCHQGCHFLPLPSTPEHNVLEYHLIQPLGSQDGQHTVFTLIAFDHGNLLQRPHHTIRRHSPDTRHLPPSLIFLIFPPPTPCIRDTLARVGHLRPCQHSSVKEVPIHIS
jgi:hypothetical protein